nr:GAF domain-containing protein [Acidobacteriota bacterium]
MKRKPKENKIEQAQSIDLLYRISKAMATVKDGRELLKIIVEYAQPVFGFYDIGLSVLDKSAEFYLDWATFYTEISPSETNLESNRQKNYQVPAGEPLFLYTFERVARDNKPFIENLNAEFIERFGDYPQIEIEIAHGYKQFLFTTLKFGGADIGILNFNSVRENHFETGDFELFQAIADLVAVAVANITANEEIVEREQEKTKLLSISREIAKVQTRRQLLDVIFNRIKSIFPYDDAGLFYFCDRSGTPDANGVCHVHLLDDLISEVNFELMQKGLTGVITEGTNVVRFLATDKAHIISLQQLMQTIPEHPHFPIMEEIGIKQLITIGIKSGGETIGMLCFNSCRENFYSEKDFPMLENITTQVAVALTNILANEEILERTREKSVLLSISEDIASARNAVELMQVIREKAQRLIPFYDTGILIVEDDGKNHYDLAVNLPGWDNSESNLKLHDLGLRRIIHPDSYVETVMNLIEREKSPVIENYERRFKEFDYPFFQILNEIGYKEAIVATLKSGGKTFGTLWLNSLEENHFSASQFGIFQTLADQIAVAVSNILANEEILEREKEKSQLLAISEQLATIRDKHDLFEVIFGELKPIFNFDDCVVALYDENLEHTRHIHSTIKGEQLGNPHYQAIMSEKVSTRNNPHGEFINYDAPRVVTLDYFLEHYPHHVGVQTMKDFGLLECVIMPLRYGGRLLGTLEFHSKERGRFIESQMPLFRNFADQMAVAISNILANEEILE